MGKGELGIEQLQFLLEMPGQPEDKKAEWLSRKAAWNVRHRHDRTAAKTILERLIHEYPQSAQAFAAQRWLNLFAMEGTAELRSRPGQ